MRESLRFVLVGHVDHGKSTLIGRLLCDTGALALDRLEEAKAAARALGAEAGAELAFLLDHLQEEREGALTIDTAQSFFSTPARDYVLIDAPGHAEFLRNMLTGASQADAAVLIVDVSRGVQEQTCRHAYLLAFLGVKEVIVALNKMDLVGYAEAPFRRLEGEVEALLQAVGLAPKFSVPISARAGENIASPSSLMGWYRGPSLLEALDALPGPVPPEDKPFVFPIQDVYDLEGKRVAVGRVEAGVLRPGAKARLLPGGAVVKISSIERFEEQPAAAHPGEAVGVTLEGPAPAALARGQVLCPPGAEMAVTTSFEARLFCLAEAGLKKGEELTLRLATQEVPARLEAISARLDSASLEVVERDATVLGSLEAGQARLATAEPLVATRFSDLQPLGRFVLARGEEICAGGIITGL
ncbi:MAG: GTP-binding protein [Candidatus Acetothermia bacterium]|jgi:translation elongation factor TU|nr:GTP-binding protein [Candidatus Acetothermia bacterium]MDH7505843.1 GTP-binding protein [Candidatus Acetothermia bacterium]